MFFNTASKKHRKLRRLHSLGSGLGVGRRQGGSAYNLRLPRGRRPDLFNLGGFLKSETQKTSGF